MKLLVVESPAKASTLRSILGAEWQVEATQGHLQELAKTGEKQLGCEIHRDRVVFSYSLLPKAIPFVERLKHLVSAADCFILAGDGDREGEAICDEVAQLLQIADAKRVVFEDLSPETVTRSLQERRRIDRHLVDAARSRQILDRMIGFTLSPMLWEQTGGAGKSAGRVQSAVLKLVCDRIAAITA